MNQEQLDLLKKFQELELVDVSKLYWIVGAIVVVNFTSILSFGFMILKIYTKIIVWKTTVEKNIEGHDKDIVNAYDKIRRLEERLIQ